MIPLGYYQELLQLWGFLLFTLVSSYLPAEALLHRFSYFTGWRRLVVWISAGIALFTFSAYLLALIHVRFLMWPLIGILAAAGIKERAGWLPLVSKNWNGSHLWLLFFAAVFSISVVGSAWVTPRGMELRGINYYDGIWNVALATELRYQFPPQHPSTTGVPLKGYHLLYNLWIGETSRLTGLPIVPLHFHYAALLMAVLFVYIIYVTVEQLSRSDIHALWGTFFGVFGGSFAFILPLMYRQQLSIDDAFGITQPSSLLVSPSTVSSIIVLFSGLLLFSEFGKSISARRALLAGIALGSAVGFKVYGGILAMTSAGVFFLWMALKKKKHSLLILLLFVGTIAVLVFFPLNAAYGFLVYQPFWPPHRVMQGPLDFTKWELKRQTLEQLGARFGLMKLELIALGIFFFGNLGTRLVGMLGAGILWKKAKTSMLFWLILFMMLVSFWLPMFFIQPIGTFNMIQFYWYFLVFSGMLAGWGIALFLKNLPRPVYWLFAGIILVFTIPSAAEKLYGFFPAVNPNVSPSALAFYNRLSQIGTYADGVIEVPAFTTFDQTAIERWFHGSGPPLIPALGNKRTFLAKEVVQFPYDEWSRERLVVLKDFFAPYNTFIPSGDAEGLAISALQKLFRAYSIRYIVSIEKRPWFEESPHVKKVFFNEFATLYEVLPL